VLTALALAGGFGAGLAHGERSQRGNLIVSLDGQLSPLKLPRDHPAPVSVRLEGGLQTADGALLPRVSRVELGLPGQAVIDTRGLPTCSRRRLRNTTSAEALSICGGALVGHGQLRADVVLPNQQPFRILARLLAFNSRVDGHRALMLHAVSAHPPTAVVLPFRIRPGSGRFGTALVADLPQALGVYPHFSRFDLTLSRRFPYRGRSHSYISASCPIPERFTAGFFSFAHASFTLAGGGQLGTGIARSCRAR
jgi:hypothetical protein